MQEDPCKGVFLHRNQIWVQLLDMQRFGIISACCLQKKTAAFKQPIKGLCLGFTHWYFIISNHWLSVTFHHLLIASFSFITLYHMDYILMSYNIFLQWKKYQGILGCFFNLPDTCYQFRENKKVVWWLRTSSKPIPHRGIHNYKCSLFGNGVYINAHILSSSNSGHAQIAVTAIIFWLCINSLSRSLGLVVAFFLVWKMIWLIEDKHWSSSVLSSSLWHIHTHL